MRCRDLPCTAPYNYQADELQEVDFNSILSLNLTFCRRRSISIKFVPFLFPSSSHRTFSLTLYLVSDSLSIYVYWKGGKGKERGEETYEGRKECEILTNGLGSYSYLPNRGRSLLRYHFYSSSSSPSHSLLASHLVALTMHSPGERLGCLWAWRWEKRGNGRVKPGCDKECRTQNEVYTVEKDFEAITIWNWRSFYISETFQQIPSEPGRHA
jgi:hypothetical protein